MTFGAILWKEWIVFKGKIISTSLSAIVGPLLYLIVFGWGLGDVVSMDGMEYTLFVIPGIIAMNAMTNSYSYIANEINIGRIYGKTFEAVMTSPITSWTFSLAKVTAGMLRGLYCALLVMAMAFLVEPQFAPNAYFLLMLTLNCGVFAGIGVICGMLIDSHGDMAKVNSFVITPMSFLCGTFFSLERLPTLWKWFFELLPLTQAVKGMRMGLRGEAGWLPPALLSLWLLILLPVAAKVCRRTE